MMQKNVDMHRALILLISTGDFKYKHEWNVSGKQRCYLG
jgi:hypothetical protein